MNKDSIEEDFDGNVQISDYWVIHSRRLHVPMLYRNDGIYRYSYGVNWRALVALLVAVAVNLPGLINAIDASIDIGNYTYFCKSTFCRQQNECQPHD